MRKSARTQIPPFFDNDPYRNDYTFLENTMFLYQNAFYSVNVTNTE